VNVATNHGVTALFVSVNAGDLACTKLLLKYNADPNTQMEDGGTLLHVAALKGHHTVLQFLLQHMQEKAINTKNLKDLTPLHMAANNGNSICMDILLKNGAGVNAADDNGITPLHLAAMKDHTECVHLLLAVNADMTIKDKGGKTALERIEDDSDRSDILKIMKKAKSYQN